MNKSFYILLFVFAAAFCKAQINLVPNPSFEDTVYCPLGADVYSAQSWSNPTDATPDYFNVCANAQNYGVPFNGFGYEFAHTGVAYAGFVSYTGGGMINGSSYREYIQSKLLSPLESGNIYKVSFYLSLGDSGTYASNNIGVFFSNTNFYFNNVFNLPFIPSCNESEVIVKSSGWQLIEYYYVAAGNENYITIGNFFNDSLTSSIVMPNNHNDPYYFIDDISVEKFDLLIPNIFTPNGDGINDKIEMNFGNNSNFTFDIYNRWGNKIFEMDGNVIAWDGTDHNNKALSDGVYFYTCVLTLNKKREIIKKGFIQLIR